MALLNKFMPDCPVRSEYSPRMHSAQCQNTPRALVQIRWRIEIVWVETLYCQIHQEEGQSILACGAGTRFVNWTIPTSWLGRNYTHFQQQSKRVREPSWVQISNNIVCARFQMKTQETIAVNFLEAETFACFCKSIANRMKVIRL